MFNEFDRTGDFAVVRSGLTVYRVECKKGSGGSKRPKKEVSGEPRLPRAQLLAREAHSSSRSLCSFLS